MLKVKVKPVKPSDQFVTQIEFRKILEGNVLRADENNAILMRNIRFLQSEMRSLKDYFDNLNDYCHENEKDIDKTLEDLEVEFNNLESYFIKKSNGGYKSSDEWSRDLFNTWANIMLFVTGLMMLFCIYNILFVL